MSSGPELHPALAPVARLLGTWKGRGVGEYPTIDDFAYFEEVTFGHVGKPFLAYSQKTRHAQTGLPLHAESGYLRATDAGLEFLIVQPTGIFEMLTAPTPTGVVPDEPLVLAFTTDRVELTPTAVSVSATDRTFTHTPSPRPEGETLSYTMAMEAVGEPMTHHLSASLKLSAPLERSAG